MSTLVFKIKKASLATQNYYKPGENEANIVIIKTKYNDQTTRHCVTWPYIMLV